MSRNQAKKNLTPFNKFLTRDLSVITIFFYLSQNKPQNPESLISFFQKNQMKVSRICNVTVANPLQNFVKNANFVAQSNQSISKSQFDIWSPFLISHVIVVAFLYQNQIWDLGRCREKNNFTLKSFSNNLVPKFKI